LPRQIEIKKVKNFSWDQTYMLETFSNLSSLVIRYRGYLYLVPIFIAAIFGWLWVDIADDGLITHRYVNNMLNSGLPHYNTGDTVIGLSSPAYFLLLTGISAIVPVELAYKAIAFAAYCFLGVASVQIIVSSKFSRTIHDDWFKLFVFALVFASNLHLLYWTFSGLETFFIPIFFVLVVMAIRSDQKAVLVGLMITSILFRPESLVALIPAAGLGVYLRTKIPEIASLSMPRRYALGSLVGMLALAISVALMMVLYSSRVIPMSILAKAAQNRPDILDVRYLQNMLAQMVAPYDPPLNFGLLFAFLLIGMAFVLSIFLLLRNKNSIPLGMLIFGTSIFSIYLVVSGASVYPWHYLFISFTISIVAMYLFSTAINRKSVTVQPVYVAVALLIGLGIISTLNYGNKRNERIQEYNVGQMVAVATLVNETFDPNSTIVVGSSGYFGHTATEMNVIDSIGLWTPEIVDARVAGDDSPAIELVKWDGWVCSKNNPYCLETAKKYQTIGTVGPLIVIRKITDGE
jgi:hypothetical protein